MATSFVSMVLSILVTVAAAACGGNGSAPEQPAPATADPGDRLAFVGTIVEVGPSPGYWSGRLTAYQEVRYRVTAVTAGPVTVGDEVTVLHPLVTGTPTVEPDTPALRAALFHPDAELAVTAERTPTGWTATDDPTQP